MIKDVIHIAELLNLFIDEKYRQKNFQCEAFEILEFNSHLLKIRVMRLVRIIIFVFRSRFRIDLGGIERGMGNEKKIGKNLIII